jgi:hypothetical protein
MSLANAAFLLVHDTNTTQQRNPIENKYFILLNFYVNVEVNSLSRVAKYIFVR